MIFTSSHKKKALSDKILVTNIEAIIILFIIFNIFLMLMVNLVIGNQLLME